MFQKIIFFPSAIPMTILSVMSHFEPFEKYLNTKIIKYHT